MHPESGSFLDSELIPSPTKCSLIASHIHALRDPWGKGWVGIEIDNDNNLIIIIIFCSKVPGDIMARVSTAADVHTL
jgi:hypothetical protein